MGTDFEFVQRPSELISLMFPPRLNFAAYLSFYGAEHTKVPWYTGHQCPGIVNDMVYASPGTQFELESAQEKLAMWVRRLQDGTSGVKAPRKLGLSVGYCADQWTMAMFLGDWTNGTCVGLSARYRT